MWHVACGISLTDFPMFCYENLQNYFNYLFFLIVFVCLCVCFSFRLILTFHMSHVSILLPLKKAQPFQQITTKWGEWSVILQSMTSPHPHAKVTGADWNLTLSHSETPSCAWCCGLVQTTISSLQARFQACHFCFPWHRATEAVLVSFCVFTTTLHLSAPMFISFS